MSLLCASAKAGDNAKCEEYLSEGYGINIKDEQGNTPLILAAADGHLDTVQLLINREADVEEDNYGGNTALMCAAANGHLTVVQYLVDQGARLNAKDNFSGRTALDLASKDEIKNILIAAQKQE